MMVRTGPDIQSIPRLVRGQPEMCGPAIPGGRSGRTKVCPLGG